MKLKQVWGAKLKVSLRVSPHRIVGSMLTLAALYTPPPRANVDGYFSRPRRRETLRKVQQLIARHECDQKTLQGSYEMAQQLRRVLRE